MSAAVRYRRRRFLAVALVALGAVVALTHVVVHLGNLTWLPITGLQDLATGYPMGGLLIVLGLVVLGREERGSTRPLWVVMW